MTIKCPKCHHTRTTQDDPLIPDYQCPACGVVYAKVIPQPPASQSVLENIKRSRRRPENLRPAVFEANETPPDLFSLRSFKSINAKSIDQKNIVFALIIAFSAYFMLWALENNQQTTEAQNAAIEKRTAEMRASEEKRKANDMAESQLKINRLAQVEQENARLRAELANKQSQQTYEGNSSQMVTTADEMVDLYSRNTLLGDSKYKGRRFSVRLTVKNINTDIFGNPYIVGKTSNLFLGPQFKFDKSQINQLMNLSIGDQITISCIGNGDVAKTPMSKDCRI